MATATLSSKSQIVVPAEVRESLGIGPGDRVAIEVEGDHAVLRKAAISVVDELLRSVEPGVFQGYAAKLEKSRDAWDDDTESDP